MDIEVAWSVAFTRSYFLFEFHIWRTGVFYMYLAFSDGSIYHIVRDWTDIFNAVNCAKAIGIRYQNF